MNQSWFLVVDGDAERAFNTLMLMLKSRQALVRAFIRCCSGSSECAGCAASSVNGISLMNTQCNLGFSSPEAD